MQVALSRVHVNKETLFLNGRAFSPLSLLPSSCLSPAEERRKRRGARRSPSVTGAQRGGISVVHERETARGSSVDLRRGRRRVLPPSPSVALPTTTPPRPSRQRPRGGEVAEAGRRLSLPPSSPSRFLRGADEQGISGVVGGGWRRTTPEAGTAAEDPEAGGDDLEVGAAADAPKDPATSSSPSNAAASSWWWPRRWPELSLSPPTPVAASPLSPSTPASASPLSHPAPAQIGETGHEARGHSRTAMPFSPVHLLTKNA